MRVLVVHNGLMLTAGIEDILSQQKDLHVKGIQPKEPSILLQELSIFQPDILILDEKPKPGDLSKLFDRLKGDPDPKIIVVNQLKNNMTIYEKKEVEVTRASDLIGVIWSEQPAHQGSKDAI